MVISIIIIINIINSWCRDTYFPYSQTFTIIINLMNTVYHLFDKFVCVKIIICDRYRQWFTYLYIYYTNNTCGNEYEEDSSQNLFINNNDFGHAWLIHSFIPVRCDVMWYNNNRPKKKNTSPITENINHCDISIELFIAIAIWPNRQFNVYSCKSTQFAGENVPIPSHIKKNEHHFYRILNTNWINWRRRGHEKRESERGRGIGMERQLNTNDNIGRNLAEAWTELTQNEPFSNKSWKIRRFCKSHSKWLQYPEIYTWQGKGKRGEHEILVHTFTLHGITHMWKDIGTHFIVALLPFIQ